MSLYYEHHVRLAGMDADGRGICKASALLNHLQIAAALAAEDPAVFSRVEAVSAQGETSACTVLTQVSLADGWGFTFGMKPIRRSRAAP